MGRILAIDYGRRRCGLAVTDTLRICANGLPTVRTCDLMAWLKDYCGRETVDMIVVGEPKRIAGGSRKSQRQQKGRADEMAAVLILTGFLEAAAR